MTSHNRLLVAPVALLVAACAVNPATGKREFMLVSESQELAMGKQYDQQLVVEMGMYDDSALAGYVQELGLRLAALSERPQLPWTFRLVDDPVVNAFAVPGGYIYITRGIMANMSSEAQLVSVPCSPRKSPGSPAVPYRSSSSSSPATTSPRPTSSGSATCGRRTMTHARPRTCSRSCPA